jgi:8-oxo-dGTP pyrophosphatase MutT (NUDIX family)
MIEAAIVTAIRARLTKALAPPPERMRPLQIDGCAVGWLNRQRAARLSSFSDVFHVDDHAIRFLPQIADMPARTRALDRVTRTLALEGALTAWRDERYAIAPYLGASPWFQLERAAARYFGVRTFAAHVNGLVDGAGTASMWFARRSTTKAIDPGMLDNLVGGGVASGQSVAATVIKESWEEAGIEASVASAAKPVGTIDVYRTLPDGLQRETIYAHDLILPRDFSPTGHDGEVVGHRLVDFRGAAGLIAQHDGPDTVTIDASLVVLDCLLRHGAIDRDSPDLAGLAALRHSEPSQFD